MAVSEADVRNIALLARVRMDTAHVPAMVDQLNAILSHMEALQSVELPTLMHESSSTLGMPLRDDGVPPVPLAIERHVFAPNARDGFFLVPRLATHSDASAAAGEDAQ